MSILSANTLFHFTGKEALISIMGTGFRPTYCKEFGPDNINNALKEVMIPMVCFCDLPLSRLYKHMIGYSWEYSGTTYQSKKYGKYGLGMSKEWGRHYRLNPVTYANPESYLLEFAGITANVLQQLYTDYEKYWESDPAPKAIKNYFDNPLTRAMSIGMPPMPRTFRTLDQLQIALSNALALLSYMKPYQNTTTGQIYYDEREWRATIPHTRRYLGEAPPLYIENEQVIPIFGYPTDQEYDIEYFKKIIAEKYMVGFKAHDIKYIIVENDGDIKDIIDRMKEFPKVYTEEAIHRLTTRILTSEQIREDF